MNRRLVLIDAGIAVIIAVLVLIVSPGVAVAAMIALAVLIVCGISFALDARRRSRRVAAPRREPRRR